MKPRPVRWSHIREIIDKVKDIDGAVNFAHLLCGAMFLWCGILTLWVVVNSLEIRDLRPKHRPTLAQRLVRALEVMQE